MQEAKCVWLASRIWDHRAWLSTRSPGTPRGPRGGFRTIPVMCIHIICVSSADLSGPKWMSQSVSVNHRAPSAEADWLFSRLGCRGSAAKG